MASRPVPIASSRGIPVHEGRGSQRPAQGSMAPVMGSLPSANFPTSDLPELDLPPSVSDTFSLAEAASVQAEEEYMNMVSASAPGRMWINQVNRRPMPTLPIRQEALPSTSPTVLSVLQSRGMEFGSMIEPRAMRSVNQKDAGASDAAKSFARLNLSSGTSGPSFNKVSVGEATGPRGTAAPGAQTSGLSAILRKSGAPVAPETQEPPPSTTGSLLTTDAANRDKQASRSLLNSGQAFPRSSYGSLVATFRDPSSFPHPVLEEISDLESEEEDDDIENKEIAVRQIPKAPSKAQSQDPPPAPRLGAIAAMEDGTTASTTVTATSNVQGTVSANVGSAEVKQPTIMEAPVEEEEDGSEDDDYDDEDDDDEGVFADDL